MNPIKVKEEAQQSGALFPMTAGGPEIRRQRDEETEVRKPERRCPSFSNAAWNHACIHHLFSSICLTSPNYRNANFPPLFLLLQILPTTWSLRGKKGRRFLQISMTTGWFILKLSSLSSSLHHQRPVTALLPLLSHFQSLTSLSQAPLCFHLKTKIYVNLWAGVNAERLVRNSIPKSWHCCWKWQGRPVNPTMRSSKCVIMLCVGRQIWISKRRRAPPYAAPSGLPALTALLSPPSSASF